MIRLGCHLLIYAALLLTLALPFSAQHRCSGIQPVPMPAERARDSYRVYSALMPIGETAGEVWPHELWLLKDTTEAISNDEPCKVDLGLPPDNRRQDFAEMLEDFEFHCHDRIALDKEVWTGPVPVRLLNAAEQQEFISILSERPRPDKYKGAPALFAFSEVYFNAKHTLALVYATQNCGMQCGEGFWTVLVLENGEWKTRWFTGGWVS